MLPYPTWKEWTCVIRNHVKIQNSVKWSRVPLSPVFLCFVSVLFTCDLWECYTAFFYVHMPYSVSDNTSKFHYDFCFLREIRLNKGAISPPPPLLTGIDASLLCRCYLKPHLWTCSHLNLLYLSDFVILKCSSRHFPLWPAACCCLTLWLR